MWQVIKTRNVGTEPERNNETEQRNGTKQMTGVATVKSMRCNSDHLVVHDSVSGIERLTWSPCCRPGPEQLQKDVLVEAR